jgi:hypothetical protein
VRALGQDSNKCRAAEVFERGLQGLADAAGGAYSVLFVDREEARQMLGACRYGDPRAAAYVEVVNEFLIKLARAPRKRGALCLTCDRVLCRKTRPLIIVVIRPHCEHPADALVSGVCRGCGTGRAGWPVPGWRERLTALMTPRLRELWGPETRFAEPIHLGPAGLA